MPVPITGGVTLARVEAQGMTLSAAQLDSDTGSAAYEVYGTVMWIRLARPILPGDSATFAFEWSFTPPPSPSDGRQGREDDVYFLGYWYPQVAVYDDVNGWVTDPYINGAEFYMDMADYDVRLTVPRGWVVGATGTLRDSASVLTPRTMERLASIRGSRERGAHHRRVRPGDRQRAGVEGLHLHLALQRQPGARFLLGHRQPLPVGRHVGPGAEPRARHHRHGRDPQLLPGQSRGRRLAARRRALHPRRHRAALALALAVPLAADDVDGRGADQRRAWSTR